MPQEVYGYGHNRKVVNNKYKDNIKTISKKKKNQKVTRFLSLL